MEHETNLCPHCEKVPALCVCEFIKPIATKTRILILQHPQEPGEKLGTGLLLHRMLPRSRMEVGLSWRNLAHALGEESDAKSWAVLYLGSAKINEAQEPLTLVDKKGQPLEHSSALLSTIKGIVVLDGTWSQAKTLWWRNAWLLKLRRAVLMPTKKSLYGNLRKEPREESLSTLESTALALSALEHRPELVGAIEEPFVELLERYRAAFPGKPAGARRKFRPWRRQRRRA